jgi:hypothetical protein
MAMLKRTHLFACSLILALSGCAHTVGERANGPISLPQTWTAKEIVAWQPVRLPGKQATEFVLQQHASRIVVEANAQSSASMLRRNLRIEPEKLGTLEFSWHVPALIAGADVGQRENDDSPARLVLAFEGDRGKFSPKNAMLNELSLALMGEPMPYATLMYIWCNKRPVGTVVQNPRTDRVRKLVVASGPDQLNQWLRFERDIKADFELAFGEAPGALLGIGVMTDSDNTQSNAMAWYGDIALR